MLHSLTAPQISQIHRHFSSFSTVNAYSQTSAASSIVCLMRHRSSHKKVSRVCTSCCPVLVLKFFKELKAQISNICLFLFAGLVGLMNKCMVSSLISQYAQVVLWFCRTGLLPEGTGMIVCRVSPVFDQICLFHIINVRMLFNR